MLEGKVEKIKILNIPLIILEKALEVTVGLLNVIAAITKELINIAWAVFKKDLDDIIVTLVKTYPTGKLIFDSGANLKTINEVDARNFYNISSGYADGGKKYIEDNGIMVKSVNDLHNYKLEKFVGAKVKEQMKVPDSRGLILNQNSSLAQNIVGSDSFKKYIHERKNFLNEHKYLEHFRMEYNDSNNLQHALHFADVVEIKVDPNTNTLTCYVIDTYDFNSKEPPLTIRIPHEFQKQGRMEGFFSIVRIKIEAKDWMKF